MTQVSKKGCQKMEKESENQKSKIQFEALFAFPYRWLVQIKEQTKLVSKLFDFLQLHQSKKITANSI